MSYTPGDVLKAEAIALGIRGMIGSRPEVRLQGSQYIEIVFTDEQKRAMIAYLDRMVTPLFSGGTQGGEPPAIQLRLGDILVPWGVKYLSPVLASSFGAGWLSSLLFGGRKKR